MVLLLLGTKKERLVTLVSLKGLGSGLKGLGNSLGGESSSHEGGDGVNSPEAAQARRDGGGGGSGKGSLQAAAMLERLFSSPSSSSSSSSSSSPQTNALRGSNDRGAKPLSFPASAMGGGSDPRMSFEKKQSIKRMMQERALRRAARCQQGLGQGLGVDDHEEDEDEEGEGEREEEECELLWQEVKDLASMPSVDVDDPPASA